MWYYWDDVVASSEKVTETYGVEGQTSAWEYFVDGFESGNFSEWSGTSQRGGGVAPSVTSTYAHVGTYSANCTTDGAQNSYSRVMHVVQDTTEIYLRSYVRFEDLPDTNGTVLWVLRVAQDDGTWIASAGVNLTDGNYYWRIKETAGTENDTQDTINADQWYELIFYFNATTNGRARLWVNRTLMCEMTGDFSSVGSIGRVYPYLYVSDGAQASSKTVYHDNYAVITHAFCG
jgi:hypothetical protein